MWEKVALIFFGWVLPVFKTYQGAYATDPLLRSLESMMNLSEEQLAALSETQKTDGSRSLTLRKHSTPLLDAHIGSLAIFPPGFQGNVLEIRTQLNLLNDLIDDAKSYHKMTFQSDLSEENYASVRQDLERSYKLIAERTKTIADSIGRFLDGNQ